MVRNLTLLVGVCGLVMATALVEAGEASAVPQPIASVAASYANALAISDVSAAWELLSSQSRAATTLAQWQEGFLRRPAMRKPPATSLLRAIAAGATPPKVGEVLVRPDEAFIEISGTVQVPQQIVLVKESQGWRVDLAETDRLNSRQAATNFLDILREEANRAAMRSPGQPSLDASYPLLRAMLAPDAANYQAVDAQVTGDRAEVTVAAEIPVNLVVRATRSGAGWAVDFARPLLPVDTAAAEPLKQAAEIADRMKCEEQLGQLARAIQMYAGSSEDMLPDPARWMEQIRPFLPQPSQTHCPSDPAAGVSYAMNHNMAGKRLHQVANPNTTPLLYESAQHGNTPAGTGEGWPAPLRHPEGNLVAFADGSVRPMTQPPSFQVLEGAPGTGRAGVVAPGRARPRPPAGQMQPMMPPG